MFNFDTLEYNINLVGKTVLITGTAGFIDSSLSIKVQHTKIVDVDNRNDYNDVLNNQSKVYLQFRKIISSDFSHSTI